MKELSVMNEISKVDNTSVIDESEITKIFKSFISYHEENSPNTSKAYKDRVLEFFELTTGSNVQLLSEHDVINIKRADIQNKYVSVLRWEGNSNNTIRTKLNSVRSFYNELAINGIMVNPLILKFKMKDDSSSHEIMTIDELNYLYEFLKDERSLSLEKYLLAKTLYITANRRSEVFSMTWKESFDERYDIDTGSLVRVIKADTKGGKHRESPISDDFYEELQQLNSGKSVKVFNMHEKTFERALKRFSEKIDKNITMHSLKATSLTHNYRATKDIEAVRELGNHSDLSSTQIYVRNETSLVNQLSYHASIKNDSYKIEELKHDELLNLINKNKHIKESLLMALRSG